jgi:hypothetical protein
MAAKSLGSAIRNRFKVNRVSWKDAGRRLEMSPNSLRAWTNRNQFPQWAVVRIAELAGLPADLEKLQEQYDFELTRVKRSSRELLDVLLLNCRLRLPVTLVVVQEEDRFTANFGMIGFAVPHGVAAKSQFRQKLFSKIKILTSGAALKKDR